jgi:hypothetical protein
MKYGFVFLIGLSLSLFSCADDKPDSSTADDLGQESFPVDVELDEEGTPLPCSIIADELLASQLSNFGSADRIPQKLQKANSQSCSMTLLTEEGKRIGEIRLIVNRVESLPDRELTAQRAKNTEFVDDLPMPAMHRQIQTLTTLIFDYNLHTYNLNVNLTKGSNEDQYELASSIAIHIADNVE